MKTPNLHLELGHTSEESQPSVAGNLDAELVKRVLKGDSSAFEPLVRKHQAALFRRARWMGLEPDTAADMVQDTFIKAYQSLRSCRDAGRFGAWVGRILRNRVLDFHKSADRRMVPLSVLNANTEESVVENEHSTLRGILQASLARLPEEQSEAFLMRHAEGYSYEEMAEITGTSVSAMKMRVHRAREMLKTFLKETGFGGEM